MAPRLLLFLPAMFLGFASCGAQTVLDLRHDEAQRRLQGGDIGFILEAPVDRMDELARLDVSAPYYAGLLAKAASGGAGKNGERAAALFEAALNGKGRPRQEAAGELLDFVRTWDEEETRRLLDRLEDRRASRAAADQPALRTLRAACLYKLGRFADLQALYDGLSVDPAPWDRAFLLLAAAKLDTGAERESGLAGDLADFFLADHPGASPGGAPEKILGEARRWTLGELGERLAELAGPAVAAAAAGRSSLDRLAYGEALVRFRQALTMEEALFFRRPALLGDLGRAFVFSAAQAEGLALFLDWNNRITGGGLDGSGLDIPAIRYRILYYIARMQRALRRYDGASDYFAQALDFAPDPAQADACIWYILSISLQEQPRETASLIGRYSSRWNQDSYFTDILDSLARYLVANRRWNSLAEVFSLIKDRSDGASIARYAYILGSALSQGFFLPGRGSDSVGTAEEYLRAVMDQGNVSLYYRSLAASRLGESAAPFGENETSGAADNQAGKNRSGSEDMEFLLGFFKHGAAGFAFEFLAADADRLEPAELRILAAAFAEAGLWRESIQTVSQYIGREGHRMTRQDLELYYPRAFTDLAEAAAEEEGLAAELFLGLIRTESAFSPGIRSSAGAVGLTQLMGGAAADMAERLRRRGGPDYAAGGEIDLEDPAANIRLGAAYLRYLMDRFESPLLALLAYNGGIGRLRRWRNAEPSLSGDLFLETVEYGETREYGRKVLSAAAAYGYLYYGMTMEAVFADIL
jgi:soluble lytic murein transglycosylase